jgi:large subunit ribosomal protein L9
MKVILKEDVEKLGLAGELVDVKDGYGRNYLIPQAKAVLATKSAIKEHERLQQYAELQAEITVDNAKEIAQQIEGSSLTLSVTTGEDDKIFGTITNADIADALADKGIEVDRRKISLDQDVKSLGEYTATVNLLGEIKPTIKFWVVKAES